jgi:hypothetical protein
LRQVEVLDIPDATLRLQFDVTLERLRTLAGEVAANGIRWPGIGTGQDNFSACQVLAGRQSKTR